MLLAIISDETTSRWIRYEPLTKLIAAHRVPILVSVLEHRQCVQIWQFATWRRLSLINFLFLKSIVAVVKLFIAIAILVSVDYLAGSHLV